MIKTESKTYLADSGLVLATLLWGSTFFIVKDTLRYLDPVILVSYRFLLASFILGTVLMFKKKKIFNHLNYGLTLGFLLWFLYIPQTIGLKYTTAANSGFITGLFVIFVPLFSLLLFRQLPETAKLIATLVSLTGLWVLTGGLKEINLGDILTIVTAMAYAAHLLAADRFVKKDFDPYVLSFQQFLFVGLFSLICALALKLPFSLEKAEVVQSLVYLAIFPTLVAFVIQLVAQKFTSPIKVSLIFALEPVFAAIFSWTIGGERFIASRGLGGLLIFLGMVIAETGFPKLELLERKLFPQSG